LDREDHNKEYTGENFCQGEDMIIKHNMTAMNAERQFGIVEGSRAKAAEKLSSGYKINRAADDAAGLAISEKMRRQIRGLNQGIENTQDGVSLCQVADGALAEVHEMLHRITELSVKAANGTNSPQDRMAIQNEIRELLTEIDRVGDTTKFNEQHVFKGTDIPLYNEDGSPAIEGFVPFEDFQLVDLELGRYPFNQGSSADHLQLQAIVNNKDLALHGKSYNLIFGNGSTSQSSIRISYTAGGSSVTREVRFSELQMSGYRNDSSKTPPAWERDYVYTNDEGVSIKMTQKVTADSGGKDEKNYGISYTFTNTGTVSITKMDFQFHVDTAYNNNDRCEGYFIGGNRVEKSCIYNKEASSPFTDGQSNANIFTGMPGSFSIVDVDNALAFTEKITLDGTKPDSFSIGHYSQIHNWGYYDSLNSHLGQNMIQNDLGFSLLWSEGAMAQNAKAEYSFKYGIAATERDQNLTGVTVKTDTEQSFLHYGDQTVWIQSGADAGDGLWVELGEMNSTVLGIKDLDVSTAGGAVEAIDLTAGALQFISAYRSRVGAQQNRMEHTIANEKNVVENTTSAESLIRDTDMAKTMLVYSIDNILSQAGQSMLSQANHSVDGVLSLLQ